MLYGEEHHGILVKRINLLCCNNVDIDRISEVIVYILLEVNSIFNTQNREADM